MTPMGPVNGCATLLLLTRNAVVVGPAQADGKTPWEWTLEAGGSIAAIGIACHEPDPRCHNDVGYRGAPRIVVLVDPAIADP